MDQDLKEQVLKVFQRVTLVVDELSQQGELLTDEQLEDMLAFNDCYQQLEEL